jgi:hypothetical protein
LRSSFELIGGYDDIDDSATVALKLADLLDHALAPILSRNYLAAFVW